MTKKVIVIGAGVSGLVAGVYSRLAGFDVEMYESHTVVGGNCTGWNRKGYHIDGCVQWLTGTKVGTGVNKIWRTCGAFSDENTQVYNTEKLATTIYEGKTYHLFPDVDKIEHDFLKISPDDKVTIKRFIKNVKCFKNLNAPVDKPFEEMSVFGFLPLIWKMIKSGKPEKKTETMTIRDYIEEFKSPVIRQLLACVFPGEMPAYALFYSLGIRTSGDGGWPVGGSLVFMKRIQQRFEELGGKIHLGSEVDKIVVKDNTAVGIKLKDGCEIPADYIIPAVDGEMLLAKFLENKYSDDYFKKRYSDTKSYLLLTGTYVSFGTTADLSEYPHNVFVKTKNPLQLNNTELDNFNVKIYNFDSGLSKEGKTVMSVLLTENEFDYWKSLKENDPQKYKEEKSRIADWVMEGIIGVFPELEGKFDMSDVATPLTFNRYCNSYRGAYMSFIPYGNVKMKFHKGRIVGLKNLFLAGQGAIPVGGLPLAAIAGKFATQRLIKADK